MTSAQLISLLYPILLSTFFHFSFKQSVEEELNGSGRVPYSGYYGGNFLGALTKSRRPPIRRADVLAEVPTAHVPNTNLQCFHSIDHQQNTFKSYKYATFHLSSRKTKTKETKKIRTESLIAGNFGLLEKDCRKRYTATQF